jgi:hypothetical protein
MKDTREVTKAHVAEGQFGELTKCNNRTADSRKIRKEKHHATKAR